jgi:HAD superfamily hydrolase (TIGR01509 family)
MRDTILWDNDGVLVDTERFYFEATRIVLADAGVKLSLAQYQQFHLVESRGSWHLAGHLSEAEIAALRNRRNALYTRMIRDNDVLVPGAVDLLRQLRPHYRMAVVTSSEREPFEASHRNSGLATLVDLILTRQDYSQSKPDPEPYLTAVARLGAAKERCVVIEDSERGLSAARAAGLSCWIVYSDMTAGLRFDGVERRFPSLREVGEALLAAAKARS